MRDEINNDNIYKEGAIICAKSAPELRLVIMKYRQRIYYCAAMDHPEQNHFAYFEGELIPPRESGQIQFRPIDELTSTTGKFVYKTIEA